MTWRESCKHPCSNPVNLLPHAGRKGETQLSPPNPVGMNMELLEQRFQLVAQPFFGAPKSRPFLIGQCHGGGSN